MFDHPAKVARLIEQNAGPPANSSISDEGGRANPSPRRSEASVDRALSVKRVFYAGYEGGIVCAVTPSRAAKQVFTVSLTHLRIALHHPLFPAVLAYQRERVRRLVATEA